MDKLFIANIDYISRRTYEKYSIAKLVMAIDEKQADEKVRDWFNGTYTLSMIDELDISEPI